MPIPSALSGPVECPVLPSAKPSAPFTAAMLNDGRLHAALGAGYSGGNPRPSSRTALRRKLRAPSHAKREKWLCHLAMALVARTLRQPLSEIRGAQRGGAPIARARQVAMYLAHVQLGLSLTEVGCAFGRDRTTVRHACRLVEDWRDHPQIDTLIACLERALQDAVLLS